MNFSNLKIIKITAKGVKAVGKIDKILKETQSIFREPIANSFGL